MWVGHSSLLPACGQMPGLAKHGTQQTEAPYQCPITRGEVCACVGSYDKELVAREVRMQLGRPLGRPGLMPRDIPCHGWWPNRRP